MKKLLDTARSLFDSFEKASASLEGLNVLVETLEICSDILNNSDDYQLKERAKNLISTHRKKVFSKIEKIMANPKNYKYEELDYWNKAMQTFIDHEFGTLEFVATQESLFKQVKNARWESMSKSEQDKEISSIIEKLNKDEKEELLKEIKELKKLRKTIPLHHSLRQTFLLKVEELTCELKRYIWDRYGRL
ncbi:MAG: hypothetical protein M0Z70_03255 [Nitrospiraceae bacterium]|nr:hypothetical protein [Nitrospiraceae bacterium]